MRIGLAATVRCAIFALLFVGCLGRASADGLRALDLIDMLQARQFTELTEQLANLQRRYESGDGTDTAVELAFRALANGDPAHQELLDEWVESMPNRFEPYAARGNYLAKIGWLVRGNKSAYGTSDTQFQGFHEYHAAALVDLQKAVALQPKYIVGYADLLGLKGVLSKEAKDAVLATAMKIDAASYELRKTLLFGLAPRWGGSYEQIQQQIEDMRPHLESNPRLKSLLGFEHYERGYTYGTKDQFKQAIENYNKALEFGETTWLYTERAVGFFVLGDHKRALDDFAKALALWPDSLRALAWRGDTYLAMGRNEDAWQDLTLATKLHPHDTVALINLADVLVKLERYEEVV